MGRLNNGRAHTCVWSFRAFLRSIKRSCRSHSSPLLIDFSVAFSRSRGFRRANSDTLSWGRNCEPGSKLLSENGC